MTKKILVIGDLHGRKGWETQVLNAIENDIHVIFLGDYVDSFDIPTNEIYDNFVNVINTKKQYPDKITLLLGNHDYAYVFGETFTSGFKHFMWVDYRNLINSNWDLFDLAWGYQGKRYTLITHAGLTNYFYKNIVKEIEESDNVMNDILVQQLEVSWKSLPLHELLNYFKDEIHLLWQIGIKRWGVHKTGSIIWADKRELIADNYEGIDQIVGHTWSRLMEERYYKGDTLYFVDVNDKEVNGINITLKKEKLKLLLFL